MQKIIQALHNLANGMKSESTPDLPALPEEVRTAIRGKAKKIEVQEVADAVLFVLNKASMKILHMDQRVSYLKREAQQQEILIQELTRALAYGNETNNYLPALLLAGDCVTAVDLINDPNRDKYTVPNDWEPSSVVERKSA